MRRFIHTAAFAAAAALAATAAGETIYATTTANQLISFDSAAPSATLTGVPVGGLATNEEIMGIDFRPATGELFAVGSFSNLYTINRFTGVASLVGANFTPGMNGAWFGFDFNPTIDRIRNVSDANQNLVLNPGTGTSTGTTNLFFGPGDVNEGLDPTVVNSAYSNNFVGAPSSQLYGIDVSLDILVTQANSAGTLGTVGPLGINVGNPGGFDISGASAIAYAALQPVGNNSSMLYRINLATGAATLVGEISGGVVVTTMSVLPEPSSLALLAVAALLRGRRR